MRNAAAATGNTHRSAVGCTLSWETAVATATVVAVAVVTRLADTCGTAIEVAEKAVGTRARSSAVLSAHAARSTLSHAVVSASSRQAAVVAARRPLAVAAQFTGATVTTIEVTEGAARARVLHRAAGRGSGVSTSRGLELQDIICAPVHSRVACVLQQHRRHLLMRGLRVAHLNASDGGRLSKAVGNPGSLRGLISCAVAARPLGPTRIAAVRRRVTGAVGEKRALNSAVRCHGAAAAACDSVIHG